MAKPFTLSEVPRFEDETRTRCARGFLEAHRRLLGREIGRRPVASGNGEGCPPRDVGTGPRAVAREAGKRGSCRWNGTDSNSDPWNRIFAIGAGVFW